MGQGSHPLETVGGAAGGGSSGITSPLGRKADALSVSVALSTEDVAFLDGLETLLAGGLPAALGSGGGLKVEASQGESASSFLSTAAVQATNVKASAGTITKLSFFKKSAGAAYLRLYDKASAPGTGDTPIWREMIPGSTAGDAGGVAEVWLNGLGCALGVGFRCTGAVADNDNTVLSANDVMGNLAYI